MPNDDDPADAPAIRDGVDPVIPVADCYDAPTR